MNTDLLNLTLVEAQEGILKKRFSSEELTTACISSSKAWHSSINAFVNIDEEDALISARKADSELSNNNILGILHGIPLAHKDLFFLENKPISCGSKVLDGFTANYNATVIEKLHKQAGAINIGRLNMAEIAVGASGRNEHFGHCRNPWNTAHMTGGSSSGSGAAVAARNIFGSLGTDTGGSVRIPSSACGLVGIKPTYGRVSRHGVMPLSYSLDNAGPMTRTVRDCARLLRVIAGYDAADCQSSNDAVPDYENLLNNFDIKGYKIGIPKDYFFDNLESSIANAIDEAINIYKKLGAEIVEVDVTNQVTLRDMTNLILKSEVANIHKKWITEKPEDYQDEVRARIESGLYIPAVDYLQALRLRSYHLKSFVELALGNCDVLYTPTMPIEPPTLDDIDLAVSKDALGINEMIPWCTRPLNYLGLPGLNVPCGFSKNNIPIGFQLIGRPFSEDLLFQIGFAYEREITWYKKFPTLHS